MKVARLYRAYDLRVEEVPEPDLPGPGEALLRITTVGICGSDLHYYREGGIGTDRVGPSMVPGHEFAAVVQALGSPVEGLKVGDRVAVEPGRSCGQCEFCLEGNPNLCPDIAFCGSPSVEGALKERMVYPARYCHPLPPGLDDIEGAMLESLGVAIHAIDLGKLRPGQTVAVLGCGPIGLLILQLARLAGASQVLATEPLAHRRRAALSYGADAAFDPNELDVVATILGRTAGRGVDVVFEATNSVEAPYQAGEIVKPGGTMVLVGIPDRDELFFRHSTVRRKGLTIKLARRMKHTYPQAIALVQEGRVDVRSMVTHRFGLDQAVEALRLADSYADNVLKTVVDVR